MTHFCNGFLSQELTHVPEYCHGGESICYTSVWVFFSEQIFVTITAFPNKHDNSLSLYQEFVVNYPPMIKETHNCGYELQARCVLCF